MNGPKTVTRFLRHDLVDVETCGQILPLIEEQDEAAAEVHHVEIPDARLHYHVIDGHGRIVLDDEEIERHRGVLHDVHEVE